MDLSAVIYLLVVPLDIARVGLSVDALRQDKHRFPMVPVVFPPVLEFFFDPAAYLDSVLRSDGQISAVEQLVQVGAQQQAVGNGMGAGFGVGFDVGGLQSRQRLFPADGTTAADRHR